MTDFSGIEVSACDHPFRVAQKQVVVPDGIDCLTLLYHVQPDGNLARHAVITVNERVIEKSAWETTIVHKDDRVVVRIVPVPAGGGGGKNILRTVLMIVVVVIAAVVSYGYGAALGAKLGIGAVAGQALTAGVTMAIGSLAVNALVPPVSSISALGGSVSSTDAAAYSLETASNSARLFSPVPIVLGFHRVVPPLGATTHTQVCGNDQRLKICVNWGYGRLKITDHLIDETPIYEIAEKYETLEGYDSDGELSLFPNQVYENQFEIELLQTDGWNLRTTEDATDEISFDIVCNGLCSYNSSGTKETRSVSFEYAWSDADADSWTSGTITMTDARASLVRKTITIDADELGGRGQFDVRVKRVTADTDDDAIRDDSYWTCLRSITNEDPLNFDFPVARSAAWVMANDLANGSLGSWSALCKTYCLDWNGSTWAYAETNNCASLFRYVLQCNANYKPVADELIDLDTLQEWHEFCEDNGLKYNAYVNNITSVREMLTSIASAGRAFRTMVDGKHSVVIDKPQDVVVQHFSPRNAWGFKTIKTFAEPLHGWRVVFNNENEDYETDERLVLDDGYTESTATNIEQLSLPGVTDPDQIYHLGRYHLAVAKLRPVTHEFYADIEHIVCTRGSRIRLAMPHALIGTAQGRIKSMTVNGSGYIDTITLDEFCEYDEANTYEIRIRHADGTSSLHDLSSVDSTGYVLSLATHISSNFPAKGDLVFYGLQDLVDIDCIVKSIYPQSNYAAKIVAVDYAPEIFTAASSPIPDFESQITPMSTPPIPVIESIKSDETVMVRNSGGTLETRVVINLRAVSTKYRAQIFYKIKDADSWQVPEVVSRTVDQLVLSGFEDGIVYTVRIRYLDNFDRPGSYLTINHEVVGQLTAPSGLQDFSISTIGGYALCRWAKLSDIDVLNGGRIAFRHSPSITAGWNQSIGIGDAAKGADTSAILPLKEGTYFARVFDAGGRACETAEIATFYTKQATVLSWANLDQIDEANGGWNGTHDGTQANGFGYLEIDQTGDNLTGTYDFQSGLDLGGVTRFRLTTYIAAFVTNNTSYIDSRTSLIDTWDDFDDTDSATGVNAAVYVRTTDDDPAGADPDWSAWTRIDSGEFYARGCEFKVILTSDSVDYNISITDLTMVAEEIA